MRFPSGSNTKNRSQMASISAPHLVAEPRVRTIVQGIQHTAADLGLITLAEYIENEQIADIVREIGIDWGQGYHYGNPVLARSAD